MVKYRTVLHNDSELGLVPVQEKQPAFWPYLVAYCLGFFVAVLAIGGLIICLYLISDNNPPSLTPIIEEHRP